MGKLRHLSSEAVARIQDWAVVTVSSSSALGCPMPLCSAGREKVRGRGHPRNLTHLQPRIVRRATCMREVCVTNNARRTGLLNIGLIAV